MARGRPRLRHTVARTHRNAHVTIDNSEYLIAHAYQRAALASDAGAKAAMADLYVTHVRSAFRHAREVSKRKLSREVADVLRC